MKPTLKRRRISITLLGIMLLLITGMVVRYRTVRPLPNIDIWFLQPVSRMKGHVWPAAPGGEEYSKDFIDEPSIIHLHLPNGVVFHTRSELTIMDKEGGMVTDISVLPLPEAVDFNRAVLATQKAAANLMLNKPGVVWGMFSPWEIPEPLSFGLHSKISTGTDIGDRVSLYLEITPVEDTDSKEWKWYIMLDFSKLK